MLRFLRQSIFIALCLMLMLLPTVDAAELELIIFHTNDQHARVSPDDDGGQTIGLANIAAAVKTVKTGNPDTLWLDAGDTFHGLPRINVSRGESMVELINAAGIDVMVPGNHDFNYGSARLLELGKMFNGSILSANIAKRNSTKLLFKPYKIFKLSDGTKVGVFGLTTPETSYMTAPTNVSTVSFLDPIIQARLMVSKLRPKVDVVIALMHMGLDPTSQFTSGLIAREVPGIDLIVDGHSHTALPDGLTVGNTLIVQTGWHGQKLGRVKLLLRDHRITAKQAQLLNALEVERIESTIDPTVASKLEEIDSRNEKLFGEVVAQSERRLTSDRDVVLRGESELGNLVSDAMRWKTQSDVAMINGGALRAALPSGVVTRGDMMEIFPFGNQVEVAELDGRMIRLMLERSVGYYPGEFGGFLDVSGMTFAFDPTAAGGSRVSDIMIGGVPIDYNAKYKVATLDFTLAGGDGYEMLSDVKVLGHYGSPEDILTEYLNAVGAGDVGVGRIEVNGVKSVTDDDSARSYNEAA